VSEADEAGIRAGIRDYIVSSWLSGDGRGLDGATDLQEVGLLDSFAMLALVAFLEERFVINLDPSDVHPGTLRNIDSIAKLVIAKRPGESVRGTG
jgi:acyl carrier protein